MSKRRENSTFQSKNSTVEGKIVYAVVLVSQAVAHQYIEYTKRVESGRKVCYVLSSGKRMPGRKNTLYLVVQHAETCDVPRCTCCAKFGV